MQPRKILLAAALVAALCSSTHIFGQAQNQTHESKRHSKRVKFGTTAKEAKFQAVTDYAYQLNREGHGQLLSYLRTKGNTLIIVANDAWSKQPYRYRLKKTQAFGSLWKKALGTTNPAIAPFETRVGGLKGRKVGGWNRTSGTWVTKN